MTRRERLTSAAVGVGCSDAGECNGTEATFFRWYGKDQILDCDEVWMGEVLECAGLGSRFARAHRCARRRRQANPPSRARKFCTKRHRRELQWCWEPWCDQGDERPSEARSRPGSDNYTKRMTRIRQPLVSTRPFGGW